MRKLVVVLAVGLCLVATSMLPIAKHGAASVGVEVGDYWNHTFSIDELEMSMDGTLKTKVIDTEGNGANEYFVVRLTGSGDFTGEFEGSSVKGGFTMSGYEKRLVSNFSLVAESLEFELVMKAAGQSLSLKIGTEGTYTPALDDYILDNNPGLGGTLVSRSTLTLESWMELEILGFPENETTTITEQVTVTQQVALSNQTLDVPAGTFECYKVTVTEIGTDTGTDVWTYYYSDVVGNYVKTVGSSSEFGDIGDTELRSYSYMGRGSGASTLFSGTNLLIIMAVIVAVLVAVSLVLMMRKRGKAVAPMPMQMPPPEMGPPPPPPPGA